MTSDLVALYRRMGLLAESGETPFVANLSFFGTDRSDSTLMMLTVSLANRSLAFQRDGDQYKAAYSVTFEASSGTTKVLDVTRSESVRVLAFRETTRADESVIFRHYRAITPGTYEVRLTVRDGSKTRGSAIEATVGVPLLSDGTISSPVPLYEATPRDAKSAPPRLIASPRATAIFGRDTIVPVYVESYGNDARFLQVSAIADGTRGTIWSDSVSLPIRSGLASGVIYVPVGRLGLGVISVGISRPGGTDTVRTPIFVAFGEDLPAASYSDMIEYLRYYASLGRLQALREASPERRAAAWAQFVRETDPFPNTPQHEGLRDYFARIAQANAQYREEGLPGWQTDRGRAFVALGRPDQIFEPNIADLSQRGRTQVWDYREHRLQILFIDQTGFGRWRMTPNSEVEFEGVVRRVLTQ